PTTEMRRLERLECDEIPPGGTLAFQFPFGSSNEPLQPALRVREHEHVELIVTEVALEHAAQVCRLERADLPLKPAQGKRAHVDLDESYLALIILGNDIEISVREER